LHGGQTPPPGSTWTMLGPSVRLSDGGEPLAGRSARAAAPVPETEGPMRLQMHLVIVALVLTAGTGCGKPGGPLDEKSTGDPRGSPAAQTGQQVEDNRSSGSPERPRPKPSPYTERLTALMEAAEMGQVSRLLELLKEGGWRCSRTVAPTTTTRTNTAKLH
jgi:hypothetical protein